MRRRMTVTTFVILALAIFAWAARSSDLFPMVCFVAVLLAFDTYISTEASSE